MGKGLEKNCGADGDKEAMSSYDLLLRNLTDYCVICLRKVSRKRKRARKCNKSRESGGALPDVAPESIVSTPGFLATLNQVWSILRDKWKERFSENGALKDIGICLKNVLKTGCASSSLNGSFSRAPTICHLCCDKVVSVENLMKAVRQQVREISMLMDDGRRRQVGNGVGDLEKVLRDKGLEETMIRETLHVLGVFSSFYSPNDLQGKSKALSCKF